MSLTRRRFAAAIALSLPIALAMSVNAQEKPTAPPASYPPVKLPPATGKGIERAMTLMAISTPQKRNTVRVLFYGQSITEQTWSKMVADDLRRRFPHANLVIENRAIGGFASQLLVKDAEQALYSFYPDLVIFHVYGSHTEYENIIRRLRERTTAEILIQTDHLTKDEDLNEETDPTKIPQEGRVWNQFMNYVFLPQTAQKYQTGRADVRDGWKTFLKENNLPVKALLKDGVHLNDYGCYVMAELVKSALVAPTQLQSADTTNGGRIQTLTVGKDAVWKNGRLTIPFDGNRVDLIAAPAPNSSSQSTGIKILIDGKAPSAFPECYSFTRSTVYPGTPWPVVMRLQHNAPLLLEDWTIRLKNISEDYETFAFEVVGSKTGPDGEGTSDKPFVSKSGRIVIAPDDWGLSRSFNFTKKPLPPNFTIRFSVVPLFQDTYTAPEITDMSREYAVTVAQGLPNGKHMLELLAPNGKPAPIRAVRIYRPMP
jgi:hypothetical protein